MNYKLGNNYEAMYHGAVNGAELRAGEEDLQISWLPLLKNIPESLISGDSTAN